MIHCKEEILQTITKKMELSEELELPPWEKLRLYGKIPWKLSLHFTLVALVTALVVTTNLSYAAYSRSVWLTVSNVLYPPNYDRLQTDLSSPFQYYIYTQNQTIFDSNRLFLQYFQLANQSVNEVNIYSDEGNYYNIDPPVVVVHSTSGVETFTVTDPIASQWPLAYHSLSSLNFRQFFNNLKKIDFHFYFRSNSNEAGYHIDGSACFFWHWHISYSAFGAGQILVDADSFIQSSCSTLSRKSNTFLMATAVFMVALWYQLLLLKAIARQVVVISQLSDPLFWAKWKAAAATNDQLSTVQDVSNTHNNYNNNKHGMTPDDMVFKYGGSTSKGSRLSSVEGKEESKEKLNENDEEAEEGVDDRSNRSQRSGQSQRSKRLSSGNSVSFVSTNDKKNSKKKKYTNSKQQSLDMTKAMLTNPVSDISADTTREQPLLLTSSISSTTAADHHHQMEEDNGDAEDPENDDGDDDDDSGDDLSQKTAAAGTVASTKPRKSNNHKRKANDSSSDANTQDSHHHSRHFFGSRSQRNSSFDGDSSVSRHSRVITLATIEADFRLLTDAFDSLTWKDRLTIFNLWFLVSTVGNIFGLMYASRIIFYQDDVMASAFLKACLGMACLMYWFALIQYLEYFPRYYIMISMLKLSVPRVSQFLLGVLPIFFGYALLGMICFGDVTDRFGNVTETLRSLFAVVNGDIIYDTFDAIEFSGLGGQLYLYIYILIFTYVVLMTIIAIVEEAFFEAQEKKGLGPFEYQSNANQHDEDDNNNDDGHGSNNNAMLMTDRESLMSAVSSNGGGNFSNNNSSSLLYQPPSTAATAVPATSGKRDSSNMNTNNSLNNGEFVGMGENSNVGVTINPMMTNNNNNTINNNTSTNPNNNGNNLRRQTSLRPEDNNNNNSNSNNTMTGGSGKRELPENVRLLLRNVQRMPSLTGQAISMTPTAVFNNNNNSNNNNNNNNNNHTSSI